ncbi:MAG: prepilin peptidase [Deltaproteobacteria bacterium]|nr:prepilin peptidase [Deltaproteobacteria bacterium]
MIRRSLADAAPDISPVHFPPIHLIPLAAILLIAVIWDVRLRRIPNLVCGAVVVGGLGVQFWNAGAVAALSGLAAGVGTVALLYPFWQRGGIGGGDVKLAGAVAIWVGPRSLPAFWLAAALAGGVVAAVCLMFSRRAVRQEIRQNLTLAALHQMMPEVAPSAPGRMSVPYAIAIALGAVAVWWRGP